MGLKPNRVIYQNSAKLSPNVRCQSHTQMLCKLQCACTLTHRSAVNLMFSDPICIKGSTPHVFNSISVTPNKHKFLKNSVGSLHYSFKFAQGIVLLPEEK